MGKLKELESTLKVLSTLRDWYDDSTPVGKESVEKIGQAIIKVFNLKVGSNGRVQTTIGDKTIVGIGEVVKRIVEEGGI